MKKGRLLAGLFLLLSEWAFAQGIDPLTGDLFDRPDPVEEVEPEPVPAPKKLSTSLRKDRLGYGLSVGGGRSSFRGDAAETFGPAPMFTMDGYLYYGHARAGLGLFLGSGKLLGDYDYQGPWPAGESYGFNGLYATVGWNILDLSALRLTPFVGYSMRSLSYEYYHGYDEEDDPSLYYSRRGPAAMFGLETGLRVLHDGSPGSGVFLTGRVWASRAGFPGLDNRVWALHFSICLDLTLR